MDTHSKNAPTKSTNWTTTAENNGITSSHSSTDSSHSSAFRLAQHCISCKQHRPVIQNVILSESGNSGKVSDQIRAYEETKKPQAKVVNLKKKTNRKHLTRVANACSHGLNFPSDAFSCCLSGLASCSIMQSENGLESYEMENKTRIKASRNDK